MKMIIKKTKKIIKMRIKKQYFLFKYLCSKIFPSYVLPVNVINSVELKRKYDYSIILNFQQNQWIGDRIKINIESNSVNNYLDVYPSVGFFQLHNTLIVSSKGIAICDGGLLLSTYCIMDRHGINKRDTSIIREFWIPATSINIDTAILLSTEGQGGYYHWIFDILPKLQLLNSDYRNSKIILSSDKRTFIKESMELLGIEDYIHSSKVYSLFVKSLVVPEMVADVGNPRLESIMFLREKLMRRNVLNSFRNIYISRKKATKRKILNETELLDSLKHYGFEFYLLEEMRFKEQIDLFQESSFIISSHGAGLSNIIFTGSNTKIIEIFPSNYFEECYQNISKKMDFIHSVIIEDNGDDHNNFIVNIPNLINEIERLKG